MGLNKQSGNMYGFVTHTWNPLAGKCFHECTYCSTNKLRKRYPLVNKKYSGVPRLEEKQMQTNLGRNNFIFVCAQNDLFANDIPAETINMVLQYCKKSDNQYLFQTKNPRRFQFFLFPVRSVLCVTIESNYAFGEDHAPTPRARAIEFAKIKHKKMLTIEPIMDFDVDEFLDIIESINPFQVNIGADSGGNNLPEPSKEKIVQLIDGIKQLNIDVFEKKNLGRLLK